jgi:hypothetical protein
MWSSFESLGSLIEKRKLRRPKGFQDYQNICSPGAFKKILSWR